MAISQAEGLHPALAARDFDVIQGRPAKKAEAMLRDFLRGGGRVEWHALSDTIADATFSHPAGGSVRIHWDIERANKAALSGKDNWKKFPRQMLRSRTVSEGVRTVWPMATSGMLELGEAADIPAEPFKGTTIEGEAERQQAKEHWEKTAARLNEHAESNGGAATPTTNGNGLGSVSDGTAQYLAKVREKLASAVKVSSEAVEKVIFTKSVQETLAKAPESVTTPLQDMIDEFRALAEHRQDEAADAPENDAGDHPDGGPRIAGEAYVGA
jgi:hypothetical protein